MTGWRSLPAGHGAKARCSDDSGDPRRRRSCEHGSQQPGLHSLSHGSHEPRIRGSREILRRSSLRGGAARPAAFFRICFGSEATHRFEPRDARGQVCLARNASPRFHPTPPTSPSSTGQATPSRPRRATRHMTRRSFPAPGSARPRAARNHSPGAGTRAKSCRESGHG